MNFTYLALGDSYTIGEQVTLAESFPCQTVELLRQVPQPLLKNAAGSWQLSDPEIIAKTGYTTDELITAIDAANISGQYDIVSLLIGVNNQYRNKPVSDFKIEFTQLLQRAIQFANNKPQHVFVLSIPDWGITPFAEGRNRQQIAQEIDAYNAVCKTMAEKLECHYIDITTSQREDGNKADFLSADGLHPSAKEYAKWAVQLADTILMDNFLNEMDNV